MRQDRFLTLLAAAVTLLLGHKVGWREVHRRCQVEELSKGRSLMKKYESIWEWMLLRSVVRLIWHQLRFFVWPSRHCDSRLFPTWGCLVVQRSFVIVPRRIPEQHRNLYLPLRREGPSWMQSQARCFFEIVLIAIGTRMRTQAYPKKDTSPQRARKWCQMWHGRCLA